MVNIKNFMVVDVDNRTWKLLENNSMIVDVDIPTP